MAIQGLTGTFISIITPPQRLTGPRRSDSLIGRALDSVKSGTPLVKTDEVAVRHLNLESAHNSLMRSHSELRNEQGRQTINQNVLRSMTSIQHELTEIQRLTDAVADGEFTTSQLNDVQLMIESRVQRIEDTIEATQYEGTELLTGETVYVTTDAVSGEGFNLTFDNLGIEEMDIGNLDVVDIDIETNAGIVTDALALVASAASDVENNLAHLETVLQSRVGDLVGGFEELRSSEMLDTAIESRRLTSGESISSVLSTGNLRNLLSTSNLRDALTINSLDPGVVASLLS